MTENRFPTAWSVDDIGLLQSRSQWSELADVHLKDESQRRATAKMLINVKTRRIAVNIAKLLELSRHKT